MGGQGVDSVRALHDVYAGPLHVYAVRRLGDAQVAHREVILACHHRGHTVSEAATLAAYVIGALDPAERRHVEQHLSACPDCTDELTRLTPLPGLLGRVSEEEVRADLLVPSPDLLDGVVLRLADLERGLRLQVRRWRLATIAACVAALVVAVVAVAPWDFRTRPRDRRGGAGKPRA